MPQLPDLIHGDLDSLESSVSAFYAERGVPISQDEDQYSTDFGKCMKLITNGYGPEAGYAALTTPNSCRNSTPHEIIILSTLAGRVDQGLGLLHELLRETLKERAEGVSPVRLWLLSEQSISFLLQPGTSDIRGLDSADGIFTSNVGILPIYGAATISTKGMEWDVQEWKTEMGGMVSTSNHVLGDEVEVVTDHVVLFTVERVRKDRG
jgi:thiamine pyrophosphokinase